MMVASGHLSNDTSPFPVGKSSDIQILMIRLEGMDKNGHSSEVRDRM